MRLNTFTEQEIQQAWHLTVNYFEKIEKVDMERMQLQLEYARKCVDAWHSGKKNVILIAPTGFGKSLMAFFLTKFINNCETIRNTALKLENKIPSSEDASSYIMTSNKFLQAQYQRDIKAFKMSKFKMLKGQANYECTLNGKSFAERECSEQSIADLESGTIEKYKCAVACPYIVARRGAIDAHSTIFNYNYWLTAMNYVYQDNPRAPFAPRLLSIFDECHVMGNIVQDMFTIKVNINAIIRRLHANKYSMNAALDNGEVGKYTDYVRLIKAFTELRGAQDRPEDAFEALIRFQKEIVSEFTSFGELTKTWSGTLQKNEDGQIVKTDESKMIYKFLDAMSDYVDKIGAMIVLYRQLGHDTAVFQFNGNNPKKNLPIPEFKGLDDFTLNIQCTNEAELIKQSVHRWTNHALFMSATLGNIEDYATQIGLEDWVGFEVPQIFEYERSPIFKVEPMISMSWKNKKRNLPTMLKRIVDILEAHPNERGLIHTGNYEIMKAIEAMRHPRIKTYYGSAEKEEMIKLLGSQTNAVVCGPSLVEGVDLKDDLCRFMVFAKVPYMSLSDKLTKRKMNIYPNWYNWTTLMAILQGLGRPIRNKSDWCVTYLLDSGFQGFFTRYSPPGWISKRLKMTKIEELGTVYDPDAEFNQMIDELTN